MVTDYNYVLTRRTGGLPWFNEWFEDYGMNKVTHTMELWAARYADLSIVNVATII